MPPLRFARRFVLQVPLEPARAGARVIALGAALAATLAACTESRSAPPPGEPPPPAVAISAVERRAVSPSNELTGRVEAIHHVEIRPRVSGHVTAVHYTEGAEVAQGTLMFTIDPRPYQATLARATAELARARARVDLARIEAERAEKLLAASAIARGERDSIASSAAQAQAEVQAAQASVELARLDVGFTQVRAPIAGRTGQAIVSVGDYVAAGPAPTLMTTIVSVDPVHVYFTGDEQTYLRFASHAEHAQVAIGLVDEPGFPHAGEVDFIDNRIDSSTGTVRVRAVVANPDKRLTPGLFARVKLPEAKSVDALLVEDRAVLTDQDRKYVYVLGAGDIVQRHDVTLGRIVDGRRVITQGLNAGDRVIVDGLQKVRPGGRATVAPRAAANTGSGA
jgi:multidrug efflux system membrane fusion protein